MRRNQVMPALVAVAVGTIAVALLIGEGLGSLPLAIALVFPLIVVVAADCVHDGDAGRRVAAAGGHAHDDQLLAAGSSRG